MTGWVPARAARAHSQIVTAALSLSPAPPQHFDLAFTAVTQPCPWPKAYGGDLVA